MKGSNKLCRLFATVCALVLSLGIAAAQNLSVSGKVSDSQGQPVVGAFVRVQGANSGTQTDLDGYYAIQAPASSSLEFSSMGYQTATVAINGRAKIDVILEDDSTLLEDAIVVGFGTQKKANLTGAVSSVDVDKTFGSKPINDVAKGLQGTVPGLTITYSSNDLGATPTMKIRGTGTINGSTQPLILLDGVEIPDMSFVNPDNVKSISVLKDAASASIYGTRAAWGVILITSKDGSGSSDRVSITYSNNFSFNQPIGLPNYITSKEGIMAQLDEGILAQKNTDGSDIEAFGMYYKDLKPLIANWFDNYKAEVDAENSQVWKYGRDYEIRNGTPYYYRVSDPNKEIFKTAFQQTHNLGINGKSGNTNYHMGLGYSYQESTLRAADEMNVNRYNVDLSTNTQVKPWLNVGAKLMYVEKDHKYPIGYESSNGAMGILYYTMRFPTFFPFGISDGKGPGLENTEGLYFRHGNAYIAGYPIANSNDQYITIGGNVTANITKALTFHGDYTRGQYHYINKTIGKPVYVSNWSTLKRTAVTSADYLQRTFVNKVSNTFNAYLDYVPQIGGGHNIAVKLGANGEDLTYDSHTMKSNGVQNYDIPTINLTNGTKEATVDETMRDRATAGFFGRINYNYAEKYLLEVNGRYDGSSSFRPGKQWAFFPSASAGYKMSQEDYWTAIKPYVNDFKLRASYGEVGNQSLDANGTVNWYPYLPTISTYTTSWVGTDMNQKVSVTTPGVVNSDMTWERIRTLDLGFDASFLDGDLTATFDWFMRRNVGMLVAGNEIIRYAGIATAPLENGGDMKTLGWELQLDYRHAFSNDLSVYGTFTLADSKSKITKWNNTTGLLTGWYEGKEVGEIWGFETDRYWNSSDSAEDIQKLQGKIQQGSFVYGPGDIKYKDLNNDGEVNTGKGTIDDHGDLKRIGNALPRYEYSFRLGAAWHGFDAEILFQGVGKRDMWTSSSLFLPHAAGAQMNIFEDQLDYWTEDNQNAKFPRPYINSSYTPLAGMATNSGNNNFYPQTKYLANLAYLRIKNLTLGYTLPDVVVSKVNIEKVRVYFSAENLLTFDHIGGVMDPELTGGWSVAKGDDMRYAGRAVPFNRQLSFGVQVTF